MKRAKGNGEFAHVMITLEPGTRDSGIVFHDVTRCGVIPKDYIPSVEKGIRAALQSGPIGSYPVQDVKVTLTGGSFHEQDSSGYAFEIAAHRAVTLAMKEAGVRLLEPLVIADVTIPHEFVGTIMSDMRRMNGRILGMEAQGDDQIIQAELPLRETFGYITRLRSTTRGLGTCSLRVSRFDFAPVEVQERIERGMWS